MSTTTDHLIETEEECQFAEAGEAGEGVQGADVKLVPVSVNDLLLFSALPSVNPQDPFYYTVNQHE